MLPSYRRNYDIKIHENNDIDSTGLQCGNETDRKIGCDDRIGSLDTVDTFTIVTKAAVVS